MGAQQQQDLSPVAVIVINFPFTASRFNRGLIVLSSNSSYILEPAPDSPNQHWIYRVDNLRLQRGACGYQGTGDADEDWLRDFTTGMKSPGQRVSRAQSESMDDAPKIPPVPSPAVPWEQSSESERKNI